MVAADDALPTLFASDPAYAGRGTHVVAFELPEGVEVLGGTQLNELFTYGSLRPNIVFNGLNPFGG
jgi:hypothetical protein